MGFDGTSILNNIFFVTEPRQPLFYVASTPNASPNTSSDWEKFPEDTHVCDSDPDEIKLGDKLESKSTK